MDMYSYHEGEWFLKEGLPPLLNSLSKEGVGMRLISNLKAKRF